MSTRVRVRAAAVVASLALVAAALFAGVSAAQSRSASGTKAAPPVDISVFAPGTGDNAGIHGIGWFVDLEVDFPPTNLSTTGFNGFQLTGPDVHNNREPFPGTFGPGRDDRLPGLVVLLSTTTSSMSGFHGPGTNLANLFNLTGVTGRSDEEIELWDTWIISQAYAGRDVDSVLRVAEVKDLNHNGIYDDAPDVVPDANNDGTIDSTDLRALGLASHIVTVAFHIA